MRESLRAGIARTTRYTIDQPRTIGFMGEACRVYATPMLVRDLEVTCRELLLQHLDPGEDSVGTRVEVDHLAPTLLGMWVDVTVTVAQVQGRAVTFDVSVRDAVEEIARGRHARLVVDVARTAARLQQKAARAAS